MDCPKCGGGVRVKESWAFPDSVIRRRVCLACGHSFRYDLVNFGKEV